MPATWAVQCPGVPAPAGVLPEPLSRDAEEWLLGRLRSAAEVGGVFFAQACADLGYTGAGGAELRADGFFASAVAPVRDVGGRAVSADQVWEPLLTVGEPLTPDHLFLVLLWFGAVAVDGVPVTTPAAVGALAALTAAERLTRTSAVVGDPAEDGDTRAVQEFVRGLARAWQLNGTVAVDV